MEIASFLSPGLPNARRDSHGIRGPIYISQARQAIPVLSVVSRVPFVSVAVIAYFNLGPV